MSQQTGSQRGSRIGCLIQSDGLAAGHTEELALRMQQHHLAHYPSDEPAVRWSVAEPGRMFTAGVPSKSSTVSCSIEAVTTRAGREQYMRGICDLWTEVTGCSEHDVLVSISELKTDDPPTEPSTETGQE